MTDLLNRKPSNVLTEFLFDYNEYQKIDRYQAKNLIEKTIKYYNGDKSKRDALVYLQDIENKWYKALDSGNIDYSVYDDDYYFTDLWSCWVIYSRKYLRDVRKKDLIPLSEIKSVIDLGCGIAYTTAALAQLFPKATVYGTNLEETKQYDFCKYMGRKYNFHIRPSHQNITANIDLVFASEYFEHIESPIVHVTDIIESLNPKYLIIANAFNTRSIGHFYTYLDGALNEIDQSVVSKQFNSTIKSLDYVKMKTGLWNNRPTIWKRCNKRL